MSKVSIEINGLRFGLRISPELAFQLVEALQGVWVASAKHRRGECFLGDVAIARDVAKSVITSMTSEIFRSARKSA
jgi:hypothetical protein